MKTKTIEQINDLNWDELDIYYWELYHYIINTLQHKVSKEHTNQFKYVFNRLKG